MSCVTETERCMVTVFDPVNKKGYDMAFNPGSANTEIFPTIGLQIYFDQKRMGGCKRVFLCKKFQAKICRANETCNSIHACRKRVCEMRKLYPCAENERCVRIISKGDGECFEVPVSKIHETAGSAGAAEAPAATSGGPAADQQPRHVLCSDFENKSCMKGALCPRIHVDPRHLHSLRALWGVPCCGDVACPSSTSVQTMHPLFARTEQWTTFCIQRSQALPKDHLACTKGLLELCSVGSASGASVSKGCLTVPAAKLCRPHLRRQCKWGMECNNVHLCRLRLPNGVTAMPQSGSAGVQAAQASPKLQMPAQHQQQVKKAGEEQPDTPKSQQQRQQTQMQLQQATVAALMQAQHLQQMQQLQGQLLLQQAAAMQLRNLQLAMPVGAEFGATLSPTHTASSTFQSAAPSAVTSPRSQLHALPSFISASGSSASDEDVGAADRSTTDSLNSSAAAFTPSIQNAAAALMAQQQRSAIEAAAAQMVQQQQQVQQQLNPVAFQNAAAAAAAFPAGMLPEGRSPLLSMLSSFQAASLPCGGVNH